MTGKKEGEEVGARFDLGPGTVVPVGDAGLNVTEGQMTYNPLSAAEKAHRAAVSRREQKAEALEEARTVVVRLGKEHADAVRSGDRARVKAIKASIADAEVEVEIAEQALAEADEKERAAAAELSRLTEEDEERRRLQAVTEKFKEARSLMGLQVGARREVIRCQRELSRLTEELEKLDAPEEVTFIRDQRLDDRDWGKFFQRSSDSSELAFPPEWLKKHDA